MDHKSSEGGFHCFNVIGVNGQIQTDRFIGRFVSASLIFAAMKNEAKRE